MKAMRYSFVSVGIWWFGFSQVSFYFLPKGNKNDEKITTHLLERFSGVAQCVPSNGRELPFKTLFKCFLHFFASGANGYVSCSLFRERKSCLGSDSEKTTGLTVSIFNTTHRHFWGNTIRSCFRALWQCAHPGRNQLIWVAICICSFYRDAGTILFCRWICGYRMVDCKLQPGKLMLNFCPKPRIPLPIWLHDVGRKLGSS